jgi:hypothetical protein
MLLTGSLLSCGCSKDYKLYINTRLYTIYRGILSRCFVKTSNTYQVYGARGITMCDKWKESFENFFNDMHESYVEFANINGAYDTTIDRINVDGNYEPSNCKWATCAEQNMNKRDSIHIKFIFNYFIFISKINNRK